MVDPMTQPPGWYDDPQDSSQLRYWDGVVWSSHTSPRVSPTVEQSTIGMPYVVTPAAARPEPIGSQGPQDGQWPPYGQSSGPHGQYGQPGWTPQQATTPDGVVLSGWWKRVLARIIDSFIIGIVALPLTFGPLTRIGTVFQDVIREAMAAAKAGSSTVQVQTTAADQLQGPFLQVSLALLVISFVYEVAFLTMTGATIGKMAVGISVRLRDRPGPPPLAAVLKRTLVKEGPRALGFVPVMVIGVGASLFNLLDDLWPLWDPKKQAIHDKAAATNVVVGRQPRRGA
jgi:uncharacterized RDD family membrane protein YckC